MKRSLFFILSFTIIPLSLNFISNKHESKPAQVENFTLTDYNGKSYSLTDFKDNKAIILMFISTQCPVSNSYNDKMNKLYEEYHSKNISVIGINSNKAETKTDIKNHASEHKFKFPILKDEKNIIADKLNAQVTPEIFVLNSNFEIQYHGRIDDARGSGPAKNNDLKNALNEILKDQSVTMIQTRAVGCTIKRI